MSSDIMLALAPMGLLSPLAGVVDAMLSMILGRDGMMGTLITLALRSLGLEVHETHRLGVILALLDRHRPASTRLYNNRPSGVVWCRDFVGYCDRSIDSPKFTFVTTHSFLARACPKFDLRRTMLDPPPPSSRAEAAGPLRLGPQMVCTVIMNRQCRDTISLFTNLTPTPAQTRVLTDVRRQLHERGRCAVFVDGPPRTGKSSLASMLTASLGDAVCMTGARIFDMENEGGSLSSVRAAIDHFVGFDGKYGVMLMDDVGPILEDAILNVAVTDDMHRGVCRNAWNSFFDHFDAGGYPNTIIILTSNVSWEDITRRDPSILRPGRIHLRATLTDEIALKD
jgi:hypothetical protein